MSLGFDFVSQILALMLRFKINIEGASWVVVWQQIDTLAESLQVFVILYRDRAFGLRD